MGGQIGTYNNDPEPGATFWFELPIRVHEPVVAGAAAGSTSPGLA